MCALFLGIFQPFPNRLQLLCFYNFVQVRRWAIRAAKTLGKVDRDDFYELKETFLLMFHVLDLDLFQNSDIYISCTSEKEKNVLLSPHLFDAKNYKDYWLGSSFSLPMSIYQMVPFVSCGLYIVICSNANRVRSLLSQFVNSIINM